MNRFALVIGFVVGLLLAYGIQTDFSEEWFYAVIGSVVLLVIVDLVRGERHI